MVYVCSISNCSQEITLWQPTDSTANTESASLEEIPPKKKPRDGTVFIYQ